MTATLLAVAVANLAAFPPVAWAGTRLERATDAAWLVAYLGLFALAGWLGWRLFAAKTNRT